MSASTCGGVCVTKQNDPPPPFSHLHTYKMKIKQGKITLADAQAKLTEFGFPPALQTAPLSSLSGGWRMKLALAQAMLTDPDMLLLDEPTNHLGGWMFIIFVMCGAIDKHTRSFNSNPKYKMNPPTWNPTDVTLTQLHTPTKHITQTPNPHRCERGGVADGVPERAQARDGPDGVALHLVPGCVLGIVSGCVLITCVTKKR